MKKNKLRQQAEEKIGQRKPASTPITEADTQHLIQELQIHQVELELQNEELVQARAEAEALHRQYTDLYDFAPVSYFTLARDGTIHMSNLTGAGLLGVERSKLVKRRLGLFVQVQSRKTLSAFLDRVFTSGKNETCEIEFLKGGSVPFWAHIEAITDSDKSETCRAVVVDITERKQAEATLRESEERFRMLFDKAPLGYQSLDENGNFIDVNQTWLDVLGYRREEVLGRWFGEFLALDYQEAFRKRFPIFQAAGQIHSEFEMLHKNGSRHFVAFEGRIGYELNGDFKQTHCILQDITERKRAEELLKESESLYRKMNENSPLGMHFYKVDNNGQLVFVDANPAANKLLGVDHLQFVGKTIEEAFPALIQTEVPARYRDAAAKGIPWSTDQIVYQDKQITGAFEVRAFQTTPGNMVALFANVTERKQAEEALRENQRFLRYILDTIPQAMFWKDIHGVYLGCNQVFASFVGINCPEDIVGKTDFDLPWPRKEAEAYRADDQEVISKKTPKLHILELALLADGRRIWADTTKLPLLNEQGQVYGVLGVCEDITERKQVEEALSESREQFRIAQEMSPDGFTILRPVRDAQERVVDFTWIYENAAVARLNGTDPEAVVGRRLLELFPGHSGTAFLRAYQQVAESGETCIFEDTYFGESITKPISFRIVVVPMAGDIAILSQDITERKQAEEKLAQYSEHLEELVVERTRELREAQEELVRKEKLAVLGQLASGVGHELRNPLGVINSAIYYLKLIQPEANDKVREYHAVIEQEVHTADKIISDLLGFARGISADRERVSVLELVQRVLLHFPAPPSVEVVLNLPADLPEVYADPRQVEQVLGNLVVNAYQAMSNGGKLIITANRRKGMVAIAVKDVGVGIPPENMPKLFEPLFSTKITGIGLGLAISQKLAEANDGRIEVQSEPGKGSTFTLFLPLESTQP